MLKNYLLIALRNLKKQKVYASVNIIGLSAGLAFTFLITAYVWGELTVNQHLAHAQNQYILQSKWKNPDMGLELTTLGPLAKSLKDEYPHLVANYYRWDGLTTAVSKGNKIFREGLQIGDSTLLTMYGFELLHGNSATALQQPFSVVITSQAAKKYFGKTAVVGESITLENFARTRHDFLITGVLKPISRNSVLQLNDDNLNQLFLSTKDLAWFGRDINQWGNRYVIGCLQLQNGVTPAQLQQPIRQLLKTNVAPDVASQLEPVVVPLKEYYLSENNGTVKKMLYTVSFISLFILLMAVVNFVNISIGHSASRIKEIGIRKVLGSMRKQLIFQFLTEAVLLVTFSTAIAILLYQVLRNWFGNLVNRPLPSFMDYAWLYWLIPVVLIFVIGIASGIYPALVLSATKAADAVKGKPGTIRQKVWSRKLLVGFQFGTAAFVLIAAIIVARQTNYFFSKDLGFDKEQIITAQLPRDWTPEGVQKIQAIKKQMATLPQVASATIAYEIQDGNSAGNVQIFKYGEDSSQAVSAQFLTTDEDYSKTYSIAMQAGSFFTMSPADSFKLVINETQAKALGYHHPQDAVGKLVKMQGAETKWTIGGVAKDFHFGSLQQQIKPVVIMNVLANPIYRYISIKLKPGRIAESLDAIQKKWSELLPSSPFEYSFMDDRLASLYKHELQLKKAAFAATALALIVVLLGVIGLVSLSVQKRIKEIGIRKIAGASAAGIVQLFVKDFLTVMLVAALVVCPLIVMVMQNWLNTYAYRIALNAWPFVAGISLLGGLTILLIIIQTIRVAWMNPSKSLRTE